ncbi:unnamed protein product [Sphagnum balticum]
MLGEKDDEDKQQIDGLGKMKADHAKRKFVEMHAFAELTVPMGKANGEGGLERQPDHCPAPTVEEAQD